MTFWNFRVIPADRVISYSYVLKCMHGCIHVNCIIITEQQARSRTDKMATNITFHDGAVSDAERSTLLKQKGATIWLTGLSASGKVCLQAAKLRGASA